MAEGIKEVLRTITVNGREYNETQLMHGSRAVSQNGVYLDYTIYVDHCVLDKNETPLSFEAWLG